MVLIVHPSEVPRAVLNILCSFVHSLFTDFCATIIRVQFALENVYPRKTESLGRKVPLLSRFIPMFTKYPLPVCLRDDNGKPQRAIIHLIIKFHFQHLNHLL